MHTVYRCHRLNRLRTFSNTCGLRWRRCFACVGCQIFRLCSNAESLWLVSSRRPALETAVCGCTRARGRRRAVSRHSPDTCQPRLVLCFCLLCRLFGLLRQTHSQNVGIPWTEFRSPLRPSWVTAVQASLQYITRLPPVLFSVLVLCRWCAADIAPGLATPGCNAHA